MSARRDDGASVRDGGFRPCGVARVAEEGGVLELRFGAEHRELAARLTTLGRAGALALQSAEEREGEASLRIDLTGRSVCAATPSTTVAPDDALAAAVRWIDALAALERRHLALDALALDDFLIEPGAALRGARLARALVGDSIEADRDVRGWGWAQLGATRGEARAVRMVAIALYRALTGETPIDTTSPAAAARSEEEEPLPLPPSVARALPPGVEGALLRMLGLHDAPSLDDARRALTRDPQAIRAHERARDEPVRSPAPTRRPRAPSTPRAAAPSALARGVLAVALVAAGAALALAALAPRGHDRARAAPLRARPLTSASASACTPCHERQVREWEGSVMAFASRSPLFGALESVVAEQVGRSAACPGGAGVLSLPSPERCVDPASGAVLTGSGGPDWCVRCHAPGAPRDGATTAFAPSAGRPIAERLGAHGREGIGCATCHETVGPVEAHGATSGLFEGNATWSSPATGRTFAFRPEDRIGLTGIGNSGYRVEPGRLLAGAPPRAHRPLSAATQAYTRSSEACGACHDVRLFGTDAVAGPTHGERFKRLRNAYSEWRAYRDGELAAGRTAARCQDCHMSLFPGTCDRSPGAAAKLGCPDESAFVARAPGERARAANGSVASHWFTSVDLPLAREVDERTLTDRTLDSDGVPMGLEARRLQLLARAVRLEVGAVQLRGGRAEVPVTVENVGAGHRVPAGFSQERELWIELEVRDARGRLVYSVGQLARPDADLADKILVRTRVDESLRDSLGRPLGMFGADVIDGPELPRWDPPLGAGAGKHVGSGLALFQNGFLRCVRCVGVVTDDGVCLPGPGQGRTRADRYEDGDYDLDTGACRSNLRGGRELFETYFPVGALDASRGVVKAPDAILDSRSLAPRRPVTLVYRVAAGAAVAPLSAHARLWFRSFPPFLVRAFAAYEASRARSGARRGGVQVDEAMLARVTPVAIAEARSP